MDAVQGLPEHQDGENTTCAETVEQFHTEAVDQDKGHHHGDQRHQEVRGAALQLFLIQNTALDLIVLDGSGRIVAAALALPREVANTRNDHEERSENAPPPERR